MDGRAQRNRGIAQVDPWQTHPEDFLVVPPSAEVEDRKKRFEEQRALLKEVVKPVAAAKALIRDANFGNQSPLGEDDFAQYHRSTWAALSYRVNRWNRANEAEELLCYDLICFRANGKGEAFTRMARSLDELPFQGVGGFGLAIADPKTPRKDVAELVAKVAFSKLFGYCPADVECIIMVQASKFNFKRLEEVQAAGIPIVLDGTGRSQPGRQILDPLQGQFTRTRFKEPKFIGTLTEEQASVLGPEFEEQMSAEICLELKRAALHEIRNIPMKPWPPEMVSALTFGRERFEPDQETSQPRVPAGGGNQPRRPQARVAKPWPTLYAEFPPESIPSSKNTQAIKRMRNVGTIWYETLKDNGMSFFTPPKSIDVRPAKPDDFDPEKIQEIGRFLGIDLLIESLYNGVPLDSLL